MTKKERIDAVIQGKKVDRLPVSFWGHFYDREETAEEFARATIEFQKKYDWDFIKMNPRMFYHTEGWGLKQRYSGKPHERPSVIDVPCKTPNDWKKIRKLNCDQGALAEQLDAIRRIKDKFDDVYVIETIFTPLSVVGYMTRKVVHVVGELRTRPQIIKDVLNIVTDTFSEFAYRCLKAGADGIYFATTDWATAQLLHEEEYLEFGIPFDKRVLKVVENADFNVLHVCKEHNYLHLMKNYNVSAVSWADTVSTNQSLKEGHNLLNKCVIGGIDRVKDLFHKDIDELDEHLETISTENRDIPWIIGPSCSISMKADQDKLFHIKDFAVKHKY